MRIDISTFRGTAPAISPLALGDGYAQIADDCDLRGGVLAPARGPRVVRSAAINTKSLYKFGWQSNVEAEWWLTFAQDVDVVKSGESGDTEERTFFCGEFPAAPSSLKKTRLGLANAGGGPYPATWLDAGVPSPLAAPSIYTFGGDPNVEPESRVYVETLVTSWSEEGRPGPPSARVLVLPGGSVAGSLGAAPSGNFQLTARRIYRLVSTGSGNSTYQFVMQIPIAQTSFTDNLSAQQLDGDILKTNDWQPPPTNMRGLIAMPNGVAAAFKDFDVLLSEPFANYAWPAKYQQPLAAPIVGLGAFGQTLVAITQKDPYIGIGNIPEEIVMSRAEVSSACSGGVSKRGIVSMPGAVLYPTRSGLAMISPSGARLLTEQYAREFDWAAFAPESMLGGAWGDRYIGWYEAGAIKKGLVVDSSVEGLTQTTIFATAAHATNGRLYAVVGTNIVAWGEGALTPYVWRSKRFHLPTPANMAVAKVVAESYPLTAKFYAGAQLRHTQTVTSSDEFSLPSGFYALEHEIQLEGTSRVSRVAMAESSQELADISA